jgi:hypothetical protein
MAIVVSPQGTAPRGAATVQCAMTPDGESGSQAAIPMAISAALSLRPALGADPDEIRDWFERETIVGLPVPAVSFAAAADYRRAARADNTRRAYRAAAGRFTDWCEMHRQTALPARPRPSPRFSRPRRGGGSPSTRCACAMPRCATCT